MNIAVNTRLLIPDKLEGIGRFTNETLKRIVPAHPEHHFIFIFDREFTDEFIYSDNVTPVTCFPPARHPVLWYAFFEWGIPRVLRKYKADLFFSPDGWLSLRSGVKSISVIHDLNFIHRPEFIPWYLRYYYRYFFPRFARKASRIATVSEFSRNDIASVFRVGRKMIDVVYNGVNEDFVPLSNEEKISVQKNYARGCPYFLFVGLIHPRKNVSNLITAYGLFRKSVNSKAKLLVVGDRKWWTFDMQEAYHRSEYKEDIIFTGRVRDDVLKKIMASALALVYTSHFEGFGLPVLEAMKCDVPVICSSVTSLPEVGGEAVLYVSPSDIVSIATAMVDLYNDPVLRNELVMKARIQREKFSWDKTAGLLWNSIEKCLY
jgi:glycosyltransferase involved in cell wall biosynthesis